MATQARTDMRDKDLSHASSADTGEAWWAGAIVSGLVGGIAMLGYLSLAFWMSGLGFWRPVQLIGGIVPAFQPPGYGFHFWPIVAGLVVHMAIAGVLGLLYGALIRGAPRLAQDGGSELFLGLAFGIASWLVVGLWFGPMADSMLRFFSPGHWFFGHALFGIGTGLTFYAVIHDRRRHELHHHHKPPLGMTPV
jgi:hypothetical protein